MYVCAVFVLFCMKIKSHSPDVNDTDRGGGSGKERGGGSGKERGGGSDKERGGGSVSLTNDGAVYMYSKECYIMFILVYVLYII